MFVKGDLSKMAKKDVKVAVAVHSYGHIAPDVYANHIGNFARWSRMCTALFLHIDGVKTAEARNSLVERAIEEGCTHIFFLDTDHLVNEKILPQLLGNAEAAVVSGLVVRRDGKDSQIGFIQKDDGLFYNIILPTEGLSYAVDACAFGCTLIDLDVFKHIEKPYFKDILVRGSDGTLSQRRSDVEFCREVRELGKDVRIDTRARVGHAGQQLVHYPTDVQYQLQTYNTAAELAKNMPKPSVIDFGCGFGSKLVDIIVPVSGVVFGVDKNECIVGCKRLHPNIDISWNVADLNESIEGYGQSDLVICADVLEHLDKPDVLVHTIVEHLKHKGRAVISTPDAKSVTRDIKINPEHKHLWNEEQFTKLLTDNGLTVVSVEKEKEISGYISMIFVCTR